MSRKREVRAGFVARALGDQPWGHLSTAAALGSACAKPRGLLLWMPLLVPASAAAIAFSPFEIARTEGSAAAVACSFV